MAETKQDNGWWADLELVYDADGDGVCECYQCQRFDNDEERIERAKERARRIARLPELEAENAELRAALGRTYNVARNGLWGGADISRDALRDIMNHVNEALFVDEGGDE